MFCVCYSLYEGGDIIFRRRWWKPYRIGNREVGFAVIARCSHMCPWFCCGSEPAGRITRAKNHTDRNDEKFFEHVGVADAEVRVVVDAVESCLDVVGVLEYFFARVGDSQVPEVNQVSYERVGVGDAWVAI